MKPTFLERITQFIAENKLFIAESRLLLAVSGGIDSMVLANSFLKLGYAIGIAHVNFKLRQEADEEEIFVKKWAEKHQIPFFSTDFDTKKKVEQSKNSLQMVARELRYDWFENIREKYGFDYILTAHTLDDVFENHFLNLIKGRGNFEIPLQNKAIKRPFLGIKREEIQKYAEENLIQWREDSSNTSLDYERNFIRHQIIPLAKKLNPSVLTTFKINNLPQRQAESYFFKKEAEDLKIQTFSQKNNAFYILKKNYLTQKWGARLLFENLKTYNFSYQSLVQILTTDENQKKIYSKDYVLSNWNEYLELYSIENQDTKIYLFPENQEKYKNDLFTFSLEVVSKEEFYRSEKGFEYLDYDLLQFPLKIRVWKNDDFFYPLGMSKKKSINAFLKDKKCSFGQKQQQYVVFSGEKIVWLVNHRIDEKFKITEATKRVAKVCFERAFWDGLDK